MDKDRYNRYLNPEPLAPWERELLMGTATATFHLDGDREIVFTGVRPDAIGPSAENPGVVGVEFVEDIDRVVHIPFVRYWEVSYS